MNKNRFRHDLRGKSAEEDEARYLVLADDVKAAVIWEERKCAYPRRSCGWKTHSNNEPSEVSRVYSSCGVVVKDRTEDFCKLTQLRTSKTQQKTKDT